ARLDQADLVYIDEEHKFAAVADDIEERHNNDQPVLVGTVSIEKSERLAATLKRRGITFEVLNAKQHEREAHVIAQAGTPGAITVATNMAGRGVDIALGGNPEELTKAELRKRDLLPDDPDYVVAFEETLARYEADTSKDRQRVIDAGGLYVLGTERHESRRIDNQLRGRSGRQGDPGESRFYLSLEDDLMRRFANERVASIMSRLKIPPDVPIEAKMVSKSIERAQNQVEDQNFEIRKNVLKYDEVMNTQRTIVYKWRNQILHGDDTAALLSEWRDEVIDGIVAELFRNADPFDWDWDELISRMNEIYPTSLTRASFEDAVNMTVDEVADAFVEDAQAAYEAREEALSEPVIRSLERTVVLSVIDNKWREHLAEMDYLRSGIGLRAMGQRDPLVEYQREGFLYFEGLVDATKADSIRYMFHVEVAHRHEEPAAAVSTSSAKGDGTSQRQIQRTGDKVGRNDACPCGSGKKYKRCHGAPGADPLPA
ncbi:MAG: SEC-C metal-binding domain-containing protein, partial [Acidimicrobiia bacterium]